MIGLVVVSHSRMLADGVAELAGQMAPDVVIAASGGDGSGGLGTDYEAVGEAIDRASSGDGVVVLYDLGSARMVAEMAAEEADAEVRLADAPLVEGAVAAAVAAQGGADLAHVLAAALTARDYDGTTGAIAPDSAPDSAEVSADLTLTNDVGLHARPAALVARALAGVDAQVAVRFGEQSADGRSVLALMGLGAPGGGSITVVASGPEAAEALRRVTDLVHRRFDE
ncbi:dihydroxyacetone kinase phosphoryl donor subunit DhaM [Actinosynnema sp. NPDC020468]|uniref:dihydroxyacetone kinase phosphoryl donor subunit DhaM n=1 Tax=Actinosynnema sp. NPDC020468 TaxID=3154488 RepID=UPI0033DDF4F7